MSFLKPALCTGLLLLAAGGVRSAPLEDFFAELLPGAHAEKETLYLSEAQQEQVHARLGQKLPSAIVHRHRLEKDGTRILVYLDRHRVRTLPETLGIAVTGQGELLQIRILHFAEPRTYKPRAAWLAQFQGKSTTALPRYKQDIDGMSGATLSGRAVTDACRRVLVLHETLNEEP